MLLDVINEPPLCGLVAVAALPVQFADVVDEPAFPVTLMDQVPEASPPVLVGTLRFVRASAAVVAPVPPLATTKVPARITAPEVGVLGVRPVVPPLQLVTPAELLDQLRVAEPLVDKNWPDAPSAAGRV